MGLLKLRAVFGGFWGILLVRLFGFDFLLYHFHSFGLLFIVAC